MSSDLKQYFSEIFSAGFIKQALVQALMPHQDRLFAPARPALALAVVRPARRRQRPDGYRGTTSW